jgi:hypothetical protein
MKAAGRILPVSGSIQFLQAIARYTIRLHSSKPTLGIVQGYRI